MAVDSKILHNSAIKYLQKRANRFFRLKQIESETDFKLTENRRKILEYMGTLQTDSVLVPMDEETGKMLARETLSNANLCVKVQQKISSLVYDSDKLRERLTPAQFKKVSDSTVTISDFAGFADFMKAKGLSFSDVSKFIDIKKTINNKRLNDAYEKGEISSKQISGTYTFTTSQALYVTEQKMQSERE